MTKFRCKALERLSERLLDAYEIECRARSDEARRVADQELEVAYSLLAAHRVECELCRREVKRASQGESASWDSKRRSA